MDHRKEIIYHRKNERKIKNKQHLTTDIPL